MTPCAFYLSILVSIRQCSINKIWYTNYFSEWKNLYLHLVLVPHPWIPLLSGHLLQDCHRVQPLHQVLHPQITLQVKCKLCKAIFFTILFRRLKKECIDTVIGKSYVGDWLLFYLLGQNIDSVAYKVVVFLLISFSYFILYSKDVVHELAKKLGYRSRETD